MRLHNIISESLLLEISDKIKDQMREKYREEDPNLTDAQIDYYLDRWDRYSQSFPPNKRDITKLTHSELEQLIDNAEARSMLKGKAKQQYDFDPGDDLLYNQNNLVIYRGDMREKCIRYGEGYTWCISRKDASNLFYTYRFRSHEPTFYFVFDKDKPTSDPYHASVIHVGKDGRYLITTAPNPGDRDTTWEGILQHIPKLRGLENLFQPKPVTTDEREFYQKYGQPVDLDTYKNFNLKEKYYYIQIGHTLSAEQQAATPKELIGVYAKMPGRRFDEISLATLERLKSGDIRKALENLGVRESYDLLVNRGFDYNPKLDAMKQYMVVILNNAKKYIDEHFSSEYTKSNRISSYDLKNFYQLEKRSTENASVYYKELAKYAREKIQEHIKQRVLNSPEEAYEFAKNVVGGPWKLGEEVIAKSAKYSYEYARDVLDGGRFEKGESVISQHAGAAALYAIKILKRPFPEGEDAIAKNAETSYEYSRFALDNGEFPKGEPAMAKSAEFGYKYAVYTLNRRFPEAEEAIATEPEFKNKYEQRFGITL